MIQSIIIYTIIIAVMTTLAKIASRGYHCRCINNKKKFPLELILAILFFTLIMGFRYEVGEDYSNYYDSYKNGDFLERFEYLFLIISYTCYSIQLPVWAYFGILAFLQILFFTLYFKEEVYILPFVFLFLFVEGSYLFWLNGIRQGIALCIWLYALLYIEKNDWKKYLFWVFIAFCFHKTVIYLAILYPLLKNGKDFCANIYFQIALVLCAYVINVTFSDYLNSIENMALFAQDSIGMGNYAEKLTDDITRESSGTGLAAMFYTACYITIILYSNRLKSYYKSKRFVIMYSIFLVGFLIGLSLPANAVILSRPFRYLYIFQPIMLSYFCYYLQRKGKKEQLLSYLIVAGYIGSFYLNQMTTNKDSHIWFQFL